ncbi:MAG: hypothetical protein ACRD0N_01845, partial [Acidimicrobiales bacterium]
GSSRTSPTTTLPTRLNGEVAIELRRRLGSERVPKLVFVDWMVLGAPRRDVGACGPRARGRLRAVEVPDEIVRQIEAFVAR